MYLGPAPVALWLELWTTELENLGLNPIRHSEVFQALGRLPPIASFLWAQWVEGDHMVEFYGCDSESVALDS